jgi:acetylornithine deacetylase/succinyl-diaminopimelate desuccinylase-like protein
MKRLLLALAILLGPPGESQAAGGGAALPPLWERQAREILSELVTINTSIEGAGTTAAAERIMARLRDAGFDADEMHLVGPDPRNRNLIVRLRGTGRGRPLLVLAHLDTVPASAADWSVDPFAFTEQDGWWYGRGIVDNKAGVATIVTNLLRWKAEGFRPGRDVIALLTAHEETDAAQGVEWVVQNRRDLIDAEYCLNTDSGGGELADGDRPVVMTLQAAEKVYQTFRLEVTNPGGHSSIPRKDNAIYQLAAALARVESFTFPVRLTEVSRMFFARRAAVETDARAADMRGVAGESPDAAAAADRLSQSPVLNAMLRTTCVATRLDAGHADNALPQRASAIVNCRLVPGHDAAEVLATLKEVIGNDAVRVTTVGAGHPSPASPLEPQLLARLDRLVQEQWNVPLVPIMETGGTDGLYLRVAGIPTYGLGAIFKDPEDVRAHGRDERVAPRWYYEAVAFWNTMVRELAK